MVEISVIIPCYNEGENLKRIAHSIEKIIKNNSTKIEFIIVNNGSTDNSINIIKELNKHYFKSIHLKNNIGYGGGILEGIKNSSGEIVSWTHGDIQCDLNDVIIAYNKYKNELKNNLCIIKGRRINRKFINYFFSKLMAVFSSIIFRQRFNEINAQPKIFNRKIISSLKNAPTDFSLDLFLLFIANKQNYRIIEFPVLYKKREFGYSKGGDSIIGKIKLCVRSLIYILKLRFNL